MRICSEQPPGFRVAAPLLAAAVLMVGGIVRAEKYECLVVPYVEVELSSGVPGILAEVLVEPWTPAG